MHALPLAAQSVAAITALGPDRLPCSATKRIPLTTKANTSKRQQRRRKPPSLPRKTGWFKRILGLIPALLVLLLVLWAGAFYWLAPDMPDTADLVRGSRQARITLLAADGSIIAERGVEGQAYVKLDEISPYVEGAVLATEDRRFYSHFGLDLIGTLRALLANLSAGTVVAGGSTITQQLAKNLYLTPERSFTRKLKELMLAVWLEARLSKTEILEVYLNRVYLGAGAYGVEAAAQRYFAKSSANLTLAESAMLAGLLKAPSRYAPTTNLTTAQARSATVARLMADFGIISRKDANAVGANPATLVERRQTGRADDFTRYVLGSITEDLGKPEEGLVVKTTLDRRIQARVEDVVESHLADHAGVQAAVAVLDDHGAIRAMMGGRRRIGDHRNRAAEARRQPGSAFKAMVFATAMEQGFTPQDLVTDEPFAVEGWTPRNAGGRYFGRIGLKEAFARSINTVAVKLSETVGREHIIAKSRQMGIDSALKPLPSLALGTFEVTPLEMAAAYQPFVSNGIRYPTNAVLRISDEAGKVLYDYAQTSAPVLSSAAAEAMREMLIAVVEDGSGNRARIDGRVIGGKTGTSQENRDAWFIGFAGRHIIAVWLGRDDQKGMKGISGSNVPAAIFRDIALIMPTERHIPKPLAKPQDKTRQETAAGSQREDGLARLIKWVDGLLN